MGCMEHYAYIVRCSDDSFYCGYTNNLENRIKTHNRGKGAKYTRARLPVVLVYFEKFDSKEEAMSREWHLKRLSHADKEALAKGFTVPVPGEQIYQKS
ncbi:MAG: GIY-YIG nuclease family protein [Butyrivibrio sp.]|nr:GIY-YIG nuclease family protein [Butyrivibrio sp.]